MKRMDLILLCTIFLIGTAACTSDISVGKNGEMDGSEPVIVDASEPESIDVNLQEDSEKGSEDDNGQPVEEIVSEEQPSEENSEEIPSEEPTSEPMPEFTVSDVDEFYYAIKSVNVRKGPSTQFERIGSLQKGEEIHITGIADTGWFQIDYHGETGYFAESYAVDKETYLSMLEVEQQKIEEPKPEEPPAVAPIEGGGVKADLVAIMNTERANNGVGGITEDATLDQLAQIRAQEIYSKFDHTRPDGTSCFTILSGVAYNTAGENIAAGQDTAAEVMEDWMNSPGHRSNILNSSYTKVGIGYYTTSDGYRTYWVQLFVG